MVSCNSLSEHRVDTRGGEHSGGPRSTVESVSSRALVWETRIRTPLLLLGGADLAAGEMPGHGACAKWSDGRMPRRIWSKMVSEQPAVSLKGGEPQSRMYLRSRSHLGCDLG